VDVTKIPQYKYGKQTTPIDFKTFDRLMKAGLFCAGDYHRSFLALLYWLGIRVSTALELKRESFTITPDILFVKIPRKKRGLDRGPLELAREWPYVDLIMHQLKGTPPESYIWNFCRTTAWLIVKRVSPKKYPHYFRLNRATQMLDQHATIPEMKHHFGWKRTTTIDSYIGYSRQHSRQAREHIGKEVS